MISDDQKGIPKNTTFKNNYKIIFSALEKLDPDDAPLMNFAIFINFDME